MHVMTGRTAELLLALLLLAPATSAAQGGTLDSTEPIGVLVADLQGAFASPGSSETAILASGFPADAAPGLGLGATAGVHVYLLRWRAITFGIGGSAHHSRARKSPTPTSSNPEGPTLYRSFTTISPQISLNFGGRNGWSYISGGVGVAHLGFGQEAGPRVRRVQAVNYGGGARWFTSTHLAFSLDLRFYGLRAAPATDQDAALPSATTLVFSIGASFK